MRIRLENLSKTYFKGETNEVTAINNVTSEIKESDFAVITGPSGSGKTTLLSLIGLLTKPTKGKIFFDGEEVSRYSDAWQTKIRKEKIGIVFQQYNLLPQFSAWENVSLPLLCHDVPKEERRKIALEYMKKLGLEERKDFKVAYLSGGEQQRIAIARALVVDPKIILADEPTASVDLETAYSILRVLEKLEKEQRTLIISTHDPSIISKATVSIDLRNGTVTKVERFSP